MRSKTTFRPGGMFILFGAIFMSAPLFYGAIPAAQHLISGVPMLTSNSRAHPGFHDATPFDLWFNVCTGAVFTCLAIAFWLYAFNATIETDETEIRTHNLFRKVIFRASWPQIERVTKRRGGRGTTFFDIYAGSEKMFFSDMFSGYSKLIAIIRSNATNADLSDWK